MTLAPQLRDVSPTVLVLRPPVTGRVLFGSLALLMISVMALDRSLSVVPTVLVVVGIAGALFTDEWRFDAETRSAARRIGTIVLARTIGYPMGPDAWIGVATTRRGRARTPFQRLVLRSEDGHEVVVEMGRADDRKGHTRLEEYARLIARHLDVELRLE